MELRTFLYSQAIVSIAVLLGDVCSFVFYGLALQFPPEQFAEVAAITGLNFVLTVSGASLGTYAVLRSKERVSVGQLRLTSMRIGTTAGIAVAVLFAVMSPLLQRFFHFASPLPFIVLGTAAIPVIFASVLQSMLTVTKRFALLALGIVVLAAGRIPAGFLLFRDGFDSMDAPIAIVCGGLLGLLFLLVTDGHGLTPLHFVPAVPKKHEGAAILELLWSIFVAGALLKIDILWAKHALEPVSAGVYGMTSLVASVLYYATMGVSRPTIAYITRQTFRTVVLWSMLLILSVCALGVLGYFLIGSALFARISDHAGDIRTVPLLLLFASMTGYSVLNFSMQCLGVLHRSVHVKVMSGVLLADVALLVVFGHSLASVAVIQCGVLLAGAVLSTGLLLRRAR